MRFGSLFAGIGGFDLGLERAGMTPVWQVERDKRCTQLLGEKWPQVERHDDVRTVGTNLARVDLICGGFPCQDVSVAGGRAGLAGERSGLWHEFARILGCARPRWCVVENVPGLFSVDEGRGFATVIHGLVELGYRVAWRVLDAQHFGLAQRRKRVFIVGHLGSGAAAAVLLEPEGVPRDPAAGGPEGEGVAPTLTGRARAGGGQYPGGTDFDIAGGVMAVSFAESQRAEVRLSDTMPALSAGGGKPGSGYGAVAYTLRAADGHHGHSGPRGDGADNLLVAPTVSSKWAKGTGGPAGDEIQNLVADPITAREGSTYTHEGRSALRTRNVVAGVRRLTPRECERLQGFPDDWTAGHSDSTRYRMLGNAVAVPVAEWIGRRILEVA